MTHFWSHRGRSVRRAALFGSVTLALTIGGLVGGAAAAAPSSANTVAPSECAPGEGASQARLRPGSPGAHDPNELTASEVAAAERDFGDRMRSKRLSASKFAIYPRVTIEVVAHVITNTAGAGAVTDRQIARQINVLNQAFSGRTSASSPRTLFSFRLVATTRTANNDWYDWTDTETDQNDDIEAKTELQQGGMEKLNLYITGLNDYLGYATFPSPSSGARDGVVLLNESLPGGSAIPYNLGDTATHEVGHWLGLYHTFQNGCGGLGDQVADTAAQSNGNNIFLCTSADTCTTQPGLDPVYNFMNYVDDSCMNRFTPGQAKRMTLQWYSFRDPTVQP